jgi:hypothetical protein
MDTTILYPSYTLAVSGRWSMRCSTYMAGDAWAWNNVMDDRFSVGTVDIGVMSIIAPFGRVDTGATVVPEARVRNHGSVAMAFEAWFILIDPLGGEVSRHRVDVSNLNASVDTVLQWPGTGVGTNIGTWTARCSVYVSHDANRANDFMSRGFLVDIRAPWPGGWREVASMPALPSGKPVKRGGWLDIDGDGIIFAAKGNKTGDFYAYDPMTDAWTNKSPIPVGIEGKLPDKGCRGVSDGENRFFMTKGYNTYGFWRYNVPGDSWYQMADVPEGLRRKKVKGGTDLAWVPTGTGAGFVYMLKGYYTEFYKYDPAGDTWYVLPDAPAGIKPKWDKGSWIVYDGENTIYAHKSKYYNRATYKHELWKFDIRGDTWYRDTLNGMPLYGLHGGRIKKKKAKDGGCGVWDHGLIRALKGGNTQQFWIYDVAADTWGESDTIPTNGTTGRKRRVKYGGDIVAWGHGAFFALKGNKTVETWRYVVPSFAGRQPARSGIQAGHTRTPSGHGVRVLANPVAGDHATIGYSLPVAGPARMTVFDAAGRTVRERQLPLSRYGSVTVDVRGLSSGIYLVSLETETYSATRKLVLQR